MSQGQQKRVYIHFHEIAKQLLTLASSPDKPGTYNICSGKPIKIIDLLRNQIQELKAIMELGTTAYPYSREVMCNWGQCQVYCYCQRVFSMGIEIVGH